MSNLLSVIIPCYNEKDHIEKLVKRVLEAPIENKEIIVVDDCSKDGTIEILKEKIEPMVSKVLYHNKNAGKGAALRTGFRAATGDVVIVQDADLEYNPNEYPKVVQPIFDGEADVVFGSRFTKGSHYENAYLKNIIANRALTFLSNLFTGLHITDMETCYKAFRREIIQSIDLAEERFGFEPEVTAKVAQRKCKVKEVSISYNPRTVKEGKKIGFKDGLRAIYCIWKYRGR
jgi:glycosyltransferase involved in cell wall biosynthesis